MLYCEYAQRLGAGLKYALTCILPVLLLCARPASATGNAKAHVTISGSERSTNGVPENGDIRVDFNGYLEIVHYGSWSSAESLAAGLAAKFSRDYYKFGLRAKAGTTQNSNLTVITFELVDGSTFGPLNVDDSQSPFRLTSVGFDSAPPLADSGKVTLQVAGTTLASVPYSAASTPATVARDLTNAAQSNALVSVGVDGASLILKAKQAGSSGDYPYSIVSESNDPSKFPSPSFPTITGSLTGGADQNSQAGTIYTYSATNGSISGYDAVGNLASVSDSVMGTWQYGYDTLNRLTTGTASTGPYANQFSCWSYDNFGNRLMQSVSSVPCANNPTPSFWAHFSAQNQIISASNAIAGYVYDSSGNITYDGSNTYLYNADGQICALHGSQGMIGYQYDGEGHRVGKGIISGMSCDLTTNGYTPLAEYILDLSGDQMTEVGVEAGSMEIWKHTNLSVGGELLASFDAAGLHLLVNDPLGSRRVQTNSAGLTEQTCQNLPFGDQLSCSQTLTAPTDHHFTGKERDSESGNDYFSARYYVSSAGIFLSPDPSGIAFADVRNPQSLNLYSYVFNNPLTRTDPSGLCSDTAATGNSTGGGDNGGSSPFDYFSSGNEGGCDGTPVPTVVHANGSVSYQEGTIQVSSRDPYAVDPSYLDNIPQYLHRAGAMDHAPNNGMPKTPQQCAGEALKKNAVALSLDVAGVGAGFLPGGDLVVAGAQATISVASGVNSAVHGDGIGSALGVLGLPATFTSYAAKAISVGGKALPGVGAVVSGLGALNDAYGTYQDYQACLAGH